jgi:hypothetical protein
VERTEQLARGPAAAERAGRAFEGAVGAERVEIVRQWALLAVVVALAGLAVWLVSPRFDIDTPSVVDDWAAISKTPDQLRDVVRLVNPEEQRFRPGWIAWNGLQWHTLDAPGGMVGPNVWNVLRAVVLVAGLCLLTALALPPPRRRLHAVLFAALAAVPALLVLTVPKFAVDLARFGPQEPLLVGGMALGGSLLALATRRLLDPARPLPQPSTAAFALAGGVLWAVGVYQKETSLAVLPLVAAALFAGRGRVAAWPQLNAGRRIALGALGLAAALPLAHVALESARIVARGDLVYDAEVDAGQGVVRGLEELYDWAHEALPWRARAIVVVALVLVALAAVVRRRIDVLAVGAVASGALSLVLVAQSGVVATRYYLPAYALFAVALALSLARLPAPVQLVGVLAIGVAFLPGSGGHDEVRLWADEERRQGAVIEAVGTHDRRGCVVAAAGLDVEQRLALPVLVAVAREGYTGRPRCEAGRIYLVVGPHEQGAALAQACAPAAAERVLDGGQLAMLFRCDRLRSKPVRDPELGTLAPERLVELRRLLPVR